MTGGAVTMHKQRSNHDDWLVALSTVRQRVSRKQIDRLIVETATEIQGFIARHRLTRPAFAWSGGKDSLALQVVCEAAGIDDCVLAIAGALEVPAFLSWATDVMPNGLSIMDNGWDLNWLRANPDMLFPVNARIAGTWFKGVQHAGQDRYCREQSIDVLLYGRRRIDGNYISNTKGAKHYERGGVIRYSPIADWSHDDVLALLSYYDISLPPCYSWPRGFRVGTGAWPARQWTTSVQHGWSEVAQIDHRIVEEAAEYFVSAQRFLEGESRCAE